MLKVKHTKDLGFHERLSGTRYLRDVVNYIVDCGLKHRPKLTREVYVVVGEKYGKSWVSVERCIRSTIERCESAEFYGTAGDVIMELVQRVRDGEFDD